MEDEKTKFSFDDSKEFDLAKTKIMYKQIRIEGIVLLIEKIIFISILIVGIIIIPVAFKYQKLLTGFGVFATVILAISIIVTMIIMIVIDLEELFTKLFNIEHHLLKRMLKEYRNK